MARNSVYGKGNRLSIQATQPATPASGDPLLLGDVPGWAETAKDANGNTSALLGEGVRTTPVKGVNAGGNNAVAYGDVLYYVAGDTPPISKKVAGVRFGVALGAVTSGSTTTIQVRAGY